MIHTQYYALLRSLSTTLDDAAVQQISQWDYNFNSVTFDQLKLYKQKQNPLPKGVVNITSVNKIPTLQARNYTPGQSVIDLIDTLSSHPIAKIEDKIYLFGLFNRYDISIDVTITYETAAQMLDNFHAFHEFFPVNYSYYDYVYDYYLSLPDESIKDLDPYNDETINIYAKQKKDDASNFEFFSRMESQPIFKCNGINTIQDKKSDTHQLNLNFLVSDTFIYNILMVDVKYFLQAEFLNINIRVPEDKEDEFVVIPVLEDYPLDTKYPEETSVGDNYPQYTTNNETTIKEEVTPDDS
jgi:hypothetical protein